MENDPYRPPVSDHEPEPKKGIWTGLAGSVLSTVLGPVWLVALFIGWSTAHKVLFHGIYGALVLLPSLAAVAFAFAGRGTDSSSGRGRKLANAIGTVGLLVVGIVGIVAYAYAIYCRG